MGEKKRKKVKSENLFDKNLKCCQYEA